MINYRLIEGHLQIFNEELFLPYCKLYNKRIWKKVWIIPLTIYSPVMPFDTISGWLSFCLSSVSQLHHIWSLSEVNVLEFWKKKTFRLSHLNECPELCGLSLDHRWSQTIPMGNNPWGKKEYFRASLKVWGLRGLIPPGLQSWPSQLIMHFANATSVAPPPAGPAGCHPLYLLRLLNLSFTIWAPNGCCILQFRAYQSFVCNLLSTPRCESQVPAKET